MLSKVVSRLKRQFRRTDARHSQPPELHRWSDFMSPFPHVEPGGYTKYYQTHGSIVDAVPPAAPLGPTEPTAPPPVVLAAGTSPRHEQRRTKPKPVAPPIRMPDQPSTSVSSETSFLSLPVSLSAPGLDSPSISASTTSSVQHQPVAVKQSLMVIPEESMSSIKSGKRRRGSSHLKNASDGSGTPLRRRKRRMLRMSSVERDILPNAPFLISFSSSHISAEKNMADNVSSNASSVSHGSEHSHTSSDGRLDSPTTPATPMSNLAENIPSSEVRVLREKDWGLAAKSTCLERPESRSSFCTARSEFSDG
ncbi:hypothetical protein AX17_001629 [Amanita inopinata Kibby_2008]|nr:hypothetical protein AX17_001629 [Amanita inopinata Kibby_2008]